MISIKIGGVPEHFNYPWKKLIKEKAFEAIGINLTYLEYSTGTGAMCKELNSQQLDAALILTEGALADIEKGGQHKILSVYVQSPLVWGIHVPYDSEIKSVESIYDQVYGISRFGSGSHLMAQVHAKQQNKDTSAMRFHIVNNMPGCVDSFQEGSSNVFFWEKFTTKPLVDSQKMRRVGVCPTPWPCFVLSAHQDLAPEKKEALLTVFSMVLSEAQQIKKDEEYSINEIAQMYDLALDDVKEWFSSVEWATQIGFEENVKTKVIDTLKETGVVK